MQKRNYLALLFSNIKVKVVSWPFKLLTVAIFLVIIGWGIYSYLFNQNPLKETSYAFITERGLKIVALDVNKEVIYSLSSSPNSIIHSSNLPKIIMNAVLAVNYILNDSRKECSPNLPLEVQLKNKCSYVYTDIIAKEYVLSNLIQANLARGDKSEDLFFKIKQYLVMTWLKKHFTINDFFTFFLNYSYYGDSIMGINSAISKFFGKSTDVANITPREAAYLAKKIFENNSYIYSSSSKSYMIEENNILKAMFELGFIAEKDLAKGLNTRLRVLDSFGNTPYKMYSNSMISVALPKTDHTNDITVYSTLNKKLQDAFASTLTNVAINYSIPHVSLFGVDNGKIITGMSFNASTNNIEYQFRFPYIKVKYLLRPLLYLSLLHNDIKIPDTLTNTNIQDVINDQNIAPSDLTKYFPVFSEKINNMSSSNNNITQQTALNRIAMQLVSIENELFSKLSIDTLTKMSTELVLPKNSILKEGGGYYLSASFDNIVNSYAVLNQGGKFYLPIFMTKINNDALKPSTLFITPFSPEIIDKVKFIIKTEEVLEKKYKVIYDFNMAIIFYENYTIGVWLGNTFVTPDQNLTVSRYSILQKLTQEIVQILIGVTASSSSSTST